MAVDPAPLRDVAPAATGAGEPAATGALVDVALGDGVWVEGPQAERTRVRAARGRNQGDRRRENVIQLTLVSIVGYKQRYNLTVKPRLRKVKNKAIPQKPMDSAFRLPSITK